MHEVVLYSRKHCGLCDEASSELRDLAHALGFNFNERDIDDDAELRARYDTVIPVVMVDGRIVAQAPFVIEELRDFVVAAIGAR